MSELENDQLKQDDVLQNQESYSVDQNDSFFQPTSLTNVKDNIINSVASCVQSFWIKNPEGKEGIQIKEVINNAINLFAIRNKENSDEYSIRHSASDFREIIFKQNLETILKKCYGSVDLTRQDVISKIELINKIIDYYSSLVHFMYEQSFREYQSINQLIEREKMSYALIKVLDFHSYKKHKLEKVFDDISVIFLCAIDSIYKEFVEKNETT